MRKSIAILFFTLFSSIAWATPALQLLENGKEKTAVRAVTSKGITFTAFDEALKGLGFRVQVSAEDCTGDGKGHKIRLLHNSAAVWLDYGIVALRRPAQVAKGHCWVDRESALTVLQALAKALENNKRYSWGKVTEEVTTPSASTSPVVSEKVNNQVGTGRLAQLTGLRFGDNGDFYRAVFDVTETGDVPIKHKSGQLTLNADTSALSVPSSPTDRLLLSVDSKTKGTVTLTFPKGGESFFWLKEPRRLVVDVKKEGGTVQPELKLPKEVGSVEKPTPTPTPTPIPTPKVPKVTEKPKEEYQAPRPRQGKKPYVVIDPGHGGKDTGATRGQYQEKVIALQIAKKLKVALAKRGIESTLTREGDTYPTLAERPAMANSLKADAFVSVHLNSLAKKAGTARGQEIYIMALPTDKDAMKLAQMENTEFTDGGHQLPGGDKTDVLMTILGNMAQNAKISDSTAMAEDMYNQGASAGVKMRRVAQAPFAVLRGTAMPAVLVETGFITHPEEVKQLASPAYQTKLAEAMAKGLENYLKKTLHR